MRIFGLLGMFTLVALAYFAGDAAYATAGQPEPWQLGFQEAVTPMMREITSFHNLLLWVVFGVAIFVLILLIIVMVKFNAKANPTPAKFSHNTFIEFVWTVVPILILALIALPSWKLLYKIDTIPEADLTIKVQGNQWNWSYFYPEQFGDEEFIAFMKKDEFLAKDPVGNDEPRLLATTLDPESPGSFYVVVPVNKNVVLQVTASDVIHNWAIPSFGVKIDAVPGRLNETWFRAEKEGVYYGQCSELCGYQHAFMPIAVHVVSEREFNAWIRQTQSELGLADATLDDGDVNLAAAQ